jgi:hypothetical protein
MVGNHHNINSSNMLWLTRCKDSPNPSLAGLRGEN